MDLVPSLQLPRTGRVVCPLSFQVLSVFQNEQKSKLYMLTARNELMFWHTQRLSSDSIAQRPLAQQLLLHFRRPGANTLFLNLSLSVLETKSITLSTNTSWANRQTWFHYLLEHSIDFMTPHLKTDLWDLGHTLITQPMKA